MKIDAPFCWECFEKIPVVGIIRGLPAATVLRIAEAYRAAGFYALEVTMNTPGATAMIAQLRETFPQLCVGAGTVCTLSDLRKAIRSGARFVVTPVTNTEVIRAAVEEEVPIFSGAFTPTEIYSAWSSGATAVKVFPATQLGAGYIKEVLAPLNEIKLLPTGGVSKANIRDFLLAGATGVGMGSSLLDKACIEKEDYQGLTDHFLAVKSEIVDY